MNSEKFSYAMSEIDTKYVDEALSYNKTRLLTNSKKFALLIAAVIALITLCGFASYEFGLFDPWLQKASLEPIKTVQSAIEGQADKDYTLTVRVEEIKIDEDETARVRAGYMGSDLAKARGWTDEYLAEHFIVVWAKYYVEYDHAKTFLSDGYTEQFFYLTQNEKNGKWTITDNTSPNTSTQTVEKAPMGLFRRNIQRHCASASYDIARAQVTTLRERKSAQFALRANCAATRTVA